MFSFVAGHLVRTMASYAAGSGISEIKCILAGFVMKGFLGFATLGIKSITLVRFLRNPYLNMCLMTTASGYCFWFVCWKRGTVCARGLLRWGCGC